MGNDECLASLPALRAREKELATELVTIRRAIGAVQDVCRHDWHITGPDGAGNIWRKCSRCGLEGIDD